MKQHKPKHALFITPSWYRFHTNQKRSLGKSLLFLLESSCQSEKLPLHPSPNNCADFSLGSLELLLVELQLKKTHSLKSKKILTSKTKSFHWQDYNLLLSLTGKNKIIPKCLPLLYDLWQKKKVYIHAYISHFFAKCNNINA